MNNSGIPIISNIMEAIIHNIETLRLYFFTSFTLGGFVKVKNPTGVLAFNELIPIAKNITTTIFQMINANII